MRKKQRSSSPPSKGFSAESRQPGGKRGQDRAADHDGGRGSGRGDGRGDGRGHARGHARPKAREITSKPAPSRGHAPALNCPRGAVMIWGRHAAQEALKNRQRNILTIYLAPDMTDWLADLDHTAGGSAKLVMMEKPALTTALSAALGGMTGGDEKAVHQGVVVVARPLPQIHLNDWLDQLDQDRPVVMLLDQITDARNIGAIMRSARAFRASALIATERHCPDENGMMLRTASGAAEHIPLIRVVNLARAMETLQDHGFMLAGMAAQGTTPLSDLSGHDRLGIVMGAEGKGLRRLTREHADMLVRIPIDDAAESLNVSNAAAVALYAAQREE